MSRESYDLALLLQRGDRVAAFRMKQIRRGKKSAEVMRARGFPNLKQAWDTRRARLMKPQPVVYHCPLCRNLSPCCEKGDVKPPAEPATVIFYEEVGGRC